VGYGRICSVFADQPCWGERISWLGVGTHLFFAKLSATTLSAALQQVLKDEVRRRAVELGARLRAEDGAAATLEALLQRIAAPAVRAAS